MFLLLQYNNTKFTYIFFLGYVNLAENIKLMVLLQYNNTKFTYIFFLGYVNLAENIKLMVLLQYNNTKFTYIFFLGYVNLAENIKLMVLLQYNNTKFTFIFFLGYVNLAENIKLMLGQEPNIFIKVCWYGITPIITTVSRVNFNFEDYYHMDSTCILGEGRRVWRVNNFHKLQT